MHPQYTRRTRPLADRFWEKVNRNGPIPDYRPGLGPCWIWTGAIYTATGYGQFEHSTAHRWAYRLTYGDIPDGLEPDHLCRVRACCNPTHLEAVTRKAHAGRSLRAQQTHCLRGHEYTSENTVLKPNGTRKCRTCANASQRIANPTRRSRYQTHCRNGHPFDEANTAWRPNGTRNCRACDRAQYHRRAHRT